MKYVRISHGFKTLLIAGSLFAITFPVTNGCNTTKKTTNSKSGKTHSNSFSDTAIMSSSDTSGGGKQTDTNKDKKP